MRNNLQALLDYVVFFAVILALANWQVESTSQGAYAGVMSAMNALS